ncbi:MFS transporter, partial [Vibrio sp. V39_P1S14PM300]|nr:MFS transporter [Vibrio sp. V39_P1S14PM300]
MANPYKQLFRVRGTVAFSFAGLLARMPISMTGIGIITMLSQMKDSYWLAGGVAATFTLAMALLAPQISRAVDRYGQSRVLPIATGIHVISMTLLLLCTHYG